MVMLGVAEAGKCGFIFSTAARRFPWGPGELTGIRQLQSQLSPGNCLGIVSMKNTVNPLKPQASEKRVLSPVTFFLAKPCLFLIPSLTFRVPVKL